jgi:hypothetical protein
VTTRAGAWRRGWPSGRLATAPHHPSACRSGSIQGGHLIDAEAGRFRPRRELFEGHQPLADDRLSRHEGPHVVGLPTFIEHRHVPILEGIGAQVVEARRTRLHERFLPGLHPFRALLCETNLPRANSQREQVAVVAPIDESLAWARRLALQERQQIDAVEVDLEGHAADRVALPDLLDQIGLPGRGREGRDEVLQRADVVDDPTRLDNARPPHHARHAPAAFPVGVRNGLAPPSGRVSAPVRVTAIEHRGRSAVTLVKRIGSATTALARVGVGGRECSPCSS